jgi:hypothetical protein
MGKKVLTGDGYTQARLAGIMHEGWCMKIGRIPNANDTIYGEGIIVTNSLTGDIGLVCDTDNINHLLPNVHSSRLKSIELGDGWDDDTIVTE